MAQAVGTSHLQVRDVLQALSLQQLLVLSQKFRVSFTPGDAKSELVNTLLASKKFPEVPRDVLQSLDLPTLRHLCWIRGVDMVSDVPEVLIDALLSQSNAPTKAAAPTGGEAFRRLPAHVRKEFAQHRADQAQRFKSDARLRHIRALVHGICVGCLNIGLGTIAYDFTLSLGLGLVGFLAGFAIVDRSLNRFSSLFLYLVIATIFVPWYGFPEEPVQLTMFYCFWLIQLVMGFCSGVIEEQRNE